MDWITGIQRALDFMENNLLSEINYIDIAKAACSSAYHFQRVFHILSGYTIGEYLRNRRLTLAAWELQKGNCRVLDAAIKYGYESSESFARAFERFHGVLPSEARVPGVKLSSFSRLSIKVFLEGGSFMDYRIEKMSNMKLLGKFEKQLVCNVQANMFWDKCREDGTLDMLTYYSTPSEKEHIGLADGSSYDGESYLYYIVTPYDGDVVPEAFVTIEIPARTWVKFRCVCLGGTPAGEEIWKKIYSEFFPSSDYEPAEYQLEVWPYDSGSYSDEFAEVWIAVNKKV